MNRGLWTNKVDSNYQFCQGVFEAFVIAESRLKAKESWVIWVVGVLVAEERSLILQLHRASERVGRV